MNPLIKKVIMIIAPENFRDEEYFHTRESLEKGGIDVFVASTAKTAISSIEKKQVEVDMLLDDVTDHYDGIVFIGGSGAQVYFNNKTALDLVKQFNGQKKIVAAICIAPMILAHAGILENKKVTVWEGSGSDIKDFGANYTGEDVTIDENIITGNGPKSSYKFGDAVAKALS
ncbi:DJ-1/PfpI family protein [Candidatus Peregrinibacteria bacterium]|nr:DJ-1/PfpI family protein [Candidatus Peregrinibacteria bacterium]